MTTDLKPSTIVIGLLVFLLVVTSAGNFLIQTTSPYDTIINDSSNITTSDFTNFQTVYTDETNQTVVQMGSTLRNTNESGLGALELGWDFLVNSWRILTKMFTLYDTSKNMTGEIGGTLLIPRPIQVGVILIMFATLTFVILGVLRRYKH